MTETLGFPVPLPQRFRPLSITCPRFLTTCAGDHPPFSPQEVEAMSRRVSPSTDKPYGIERVTRLWRVSRASVYRRPSEGIVRGRPGPRGAMAAEDLVGAIRKLLADSPFHGE